MQNNFSEPLAELIKDWQSGEFTDKQIKEKFVDIDFFSTKDIDDTLTLVGDLKFETIAETIRAMSLSYLEKIKFLDVIGVTNEYEKDDIAYAEKYGEKALLEKIDKEVRVMLGI